MLDSAQWEPPGPLLCLFHIHLLLRHLLACPQPLRLRSAASVHRICSVPPHPVCLASFTQMPRCPVCRPPPFRLSSCPSQKPPSWGADIHWTPPCGVGRRDGAPLSEKKESLGTRGRRSLKGGGVPCTPGVLLVLGSPLVGSQAGNRAGRLGSYPTLGPQEVAGGRDPRGHRDTPRDPGGSASPHFAFPPQTLDPVPARANENCPLAMVLAALSKRQESPSL